MPTKFPDSRSYEGFNAPLRLEGEIFDLEVTQGEIPADLHGSLFRLQPDAQFPPRIDDGTAMINGDGLVTVFRFEEGHVDFQSRYVRTEKFVLEREARRALFGKYRNPFTDDPRVERASRGTANTHLLWHAGRLCALKEDSLPVEIDPFTLDTVGPYRFNGDYTSPTFTAHPKTDPRTGGLVFFGYEAKGLATSDIAYYEADSAGLITHETWFQAPYSSMVHDFFVTENFVVFPVTPLISDLGRMEEHQSHFAWDPDLPTYLGVLRRGDDGKNIRWYQSSACFIAHSMNAYEEDGKLHLFSPVGGESGFPFFPHVDNGPWNSQQATPFLYDWVVDLSSQSFDYHRDRCHDHAGELPRIDERYTGASFNYGYFCHMDATGENLLGLGDGVGCYDRRTGNVAVHSPGEASSVQEPIFVPSPGSEEEADGYIFTVVNRHNEMRSDVLLLDARNVDSEPVATIKLPIRLPDGIHGYWISAEELANSVRLQDESKSARLAPEPTAWTG